GHGNCYLSPPRVTHEGNILMTITGIIPFADPETDTRERILANLDMQGVLPFIAEHIDWIYSPHDGRGLTTLTGQPPVSPAPLPLSIPAEVNYEVDYPPALGVGLMPTEVGLKNIFLA